MSDIDPNDAGAHGRPLGRGLEDVSHLFLSPRPGDASRSAGPPGTGGGIVLLRPVQIPRDRLATFLMEGEGALEEGLRPIDAKLPCHPCGEIDLLAVDRASKLTIIDFETTVNDGLLARGLGHFDWIVRNIGNVQRMYPAKGADFSLPPRLVLLAPQFSAVLRRVAGHITRPHIQWLRYHTVETPGGPGILCEPVHGE